MGWKDVARRATVLVTELSERAQDLQQQVQETRRESTAEEPSSPPGGPAELSITVTGGEQGTLVVTLPCVRTEEHGQWTLRLAAPDPVPLGTTSLSALSLSVPAYDGPRRYDLGGADWEPFDLHLAPVAEVDDRTWFADLQATPPPVVEIGPDSVSFDVPMGSAVNAIRVVGTVRL